MSYYQDLMTQENLVRRAAWLAFETRKKTAVYMTHGELVVEEYDPRRAGQVLEVFTPGRQRPPKREDTGAPVISASCFPVQKEQTPEPEPEPEPEPKRPAKNGWGIPTF